MSRSEATTEADKMHEECLKGVTSIPIKSQIAKKRCNTEKDAFLEQNKKDRMNAIQVIDDGSKYLTEGLDADAVDAPDRLLMEEGARVRAAEGARVAQGSRSSRHKHRLGQGGVIAGRTRTD